MFKKSERLKQSEFSQYFKTGKRHHFPNLTVITQKSPTRKISVVVGKKVAKSAARRNTLTRRVYAELRELLEVKTVGVIIVIVKPGFNSLTRANAQIAVKEAIDQVIKNT